MDFSQPLKRVPPHRILAVNRGEKDGALYAWIDIDPSLMTEVITDILVKENGWILSHLLADACADAFKRLIDPSLQREMRRQLTDKADEHAIRVFARNLEALLMTPPVRGKVILGIDPGFRTGCKAAVIDATGSYLEGITIYPHPPQEKWEEAKEILNRLVQKHGVELAAIGNGTASRETEKLVAEIIAERCPDLRYTIVSEAGASVYSASAVAREEFPQLEASMRGNISIARRLMDPLAELVKIDPKSIGVGLYQHDVDQTKLADSLHDVVESCVNRVGVNLNTASFSLLTYVSGINSRTARSIATHREQKGPFTTRQELLTVSGLGDKAFQQCAGFLRIPESENLLDATAVHPESYGSTSKLLNHVNLSMDEVRRDGSILSDKLNKDGNLKDLAVVCDCGVETLKDIVEALKKPDRDPRQQMEPPLLRSDILDIDDLYEGLVLKGTVRNVVDFGAFVDVGLKQDGLVHLSNLAKRYVKDPLEVVSVGDIIEVKVIKVDRERGRISLSMVLED